MKYLNDGLNTHPNRLDICKTSTQRQSSVVSERQSTFSQSQSQQQPGPFGQPSSAAPASFGQPSGFNQVIAPAGFAAPSFGAPAASQQHSAFGQPQNTHFGPAGLQPASIPALPNSTQPLTNSSPFSQQQQSLQQSHGLGQPQQNLFGQAQPQTQAFGQPQAPAFGQPAFGQPAITGFGNPGAQSTLSSSQAPALAVPFGNQPPMPQTQSYGQTQLQQNGGTLFGGVASSVITPLAGQQPSGVANSSLSLLSTITASANGATSNALPAAQPSTTSLNLQPLPAADIRSYTTRDASNRLLTWRGQPVTYNPAGEPCIRVAGGLERVWFPDGPPTASTNNEDPRLQYPPEVMGAYGFLSHNSIFYEGVMPEVAPRPEWCRWDI